MYVVIVVLLVVAAGVGGSPAAAGELLALVSVAFFVYWAVTSGKDRRACPRCGEGVPVGVLDCAKCGFDFRTIGAKTE